MESGSLTTRPLSLRRWSPGSTLSRRVGSGGDHVSERSNSSRDGSPSCVAAWAEVTEKFCAAAVLPLVPARIRTYYGVMRAVSDEAKQEADRRWKAEVPRMRPLPVHFLWLGPHTFVVALGLVILILVAAT